MCDYGKRASKHARGSQEIALGAGGRLPLCLRQQATGGLSNSHLAAATPALQARNSPPSFTRVLEILTRSLTFVQHVLYPRSHLSSS